jgi:hypothetical protein
MLPKKRTNKMNNKYAQLLKACQQLQPYPQGEDQGDSMLEVFAQTWP